QMLSNTLLLACPQSYHGPIRHIGGYRGVGDRGSGFQGAPSGLTCDIHETTHGLRHWVDAWPMTVGARLSKGTYRDIDNLRVVLAGTLVIDAQPLLGRRTHIGDHNIGTSRQLVVHLESCRLPEVEHHAPLVTVDANIRATVHSNTWSHMTA